MSILTCPHDISNHQTDHLYEEMGGSDGTLHENGCCGTTRGGPEEGSA